jgi:hypothetical protein
VPLLAGGIAPARADFNAVMRMLSIHTVFGQSGGVYPWVGASADFPGLNYLRGWHVLGDDGDEYIARLPNGPGVPAAGGGFVGPINPVLDNGKYWWNMTEALEKGSSGSGYVVGDSKLWRFRPNQLPKGWIHENGDRFPEGTSEYEALDAFTPEFKADNGITMLEIGGVKTQNVPDAYYSDRRGMFRRPGTPVGSVIGDAVRNFTGEFFSLHNNWNDPNSALFRVAGTGNRLAAGSTTMEGRMGLDVSRVVPTADENRPLHVCLTPAIYLGPPR